MSFPFHEVNVEAAPSYAPDDGRPPQSDRDAKSRCRPALSRRNACPIVIAAFLIALISAVGSTGHAQTYSESVLYAPQSISNGINLFAPVIQASDGDFYGVATYSVTAGNNAGSVIFKVSPSGQSAVLYGFVANTDATRIGLTQGGDGNLYGVLTTGGTNNNSSGLIFNVSMSGSYSTVYTFCSNPPPSGACADGRNPFGVLIQGSDGSFYGTTASGGTNDGAGTVFKVTPSGTFTTLYSFCSQGGTTNCSDGLAPSAGLVQGADGNFYGTTQYGGINCGASNPIGTYQGCGTIFKITPDGHETVVHSFTGGEDGSFPTSRLVEGADGSLYGVTYFGPNETYVTQGPSAIFKLAPDGTLSNLATLSANEGDEVGVIFGSDGNLYGTDYGGGSDGQGSIYQIDASGTTATIYEFACSPGSTDCPDGAEPYAQPVQGSDGNLYGTTLYGGNLLGNYASSTVYKLSVSPALQPPVSLSFSQQTVQPGQTVTLNWSVANAYSMTLQQCYAFIQGSPSGAGNWTGLQAGTFSASSTPPYSGSTTVTPTTDGVYGYALTCGGTESGFATLIVGAPPTLSVTTKLLPAGQAGMAYSQPVAAAGGVAPYSWSVSSGSLPVGLSLSSGTGVISGTPTAAGTSNFTIEVKDSESTPQTATGGLAITVNPAPLGVTTTTLPAGNVGTAYSQTLQASGGIAPYTWSVMSGTLPPGLSLSSSSGVISGTPTSAATFVFNVQVKDSETTPQTATVGLNIAITPSTLVLSTLSVPNATAGMAYSQTLQAVGGVTPYSWSISSGNLPGGLTLGSGNGIISGVPTGVGTANFTVQVMDSESTPEIATGSLSITVTGATPSVSLTAQPNTGLVYGQSITLAATESPVEGIAQGYSWTISEDGSPLVAGALSNGNGSYSMMTTPHAGQHSFTATYSSTQSLYPAGTSNTVSLTVAKATPTVSAWPTTSVITYGQTLASSTLSGGTASTAGTFAWTTPITAPGAGTTSQSVTFTPTDTTDYNTVTGTAPVTVNKATPTVTAWPTASAITVGQALSSSILSGGTASVAGTFAWTSPSTVPAVGSYSGSVTFAPTNGTDYNTVSGTATVSVNAAQSFTLSAAPTTLSVAQGGSETTTITVTDIGGFSGTVSLAASGLPTSVTASFAAGSSPGTQVLTLTAGASAQVTSPAVTITVTGTSGATTATTSISLNITPQPGFTAGSGGTTSISVAPGATSGDTGTISVAGTNGFSGTINLSCAVATSMTNVSDMPSCSLNPLSVIISGTATQTSTLTVTTTAPTNAKNERRLFWPTDGAALALLLFFTVRRKQRNWLTSARMVFLLILISTVGCGGGGTTGGRGTGTTPGSYTITVTGTSGAISNTVGTINLTVQ